MSLKRRNIGSSRTEGVKNMKNAYTTIPTEGIICKLLYLYDLQKQMGLLGNGLEWLRLQITAKTTDFAVCYNA